MYGNLTSIRELTKSLGNVEVSAQKSFSENCSFLASTSAGADQIVSEHIIYSHPCIVVHLKILFHMMLLHSYVPNSFGSGIVVPLVKDKCGDMSSVENYRPITLSPVISKIFESVLILKYGMFLNVNDRRFGFRKKCKL